jgi:hypothetical protein
VRQAQRARLALQAQQVQLVILVQQVQLAQQALALLTITWVLTTMDIPISQVQ